MMLQEAAETDDLKAVVSEGAGMRSVREAVDLTGSERWFAVPVFALVTGATAIFASDLPPPGLKELSAEISAPVFFIYATPARAARASADLLRGREPAQADLGREGGHTGAASAQPEEYERRVVTFFDDALLDRN